MQNNLLRMATVTAMILGGFAAPLHAATFTVTKTADTADGKCDADCSLREAVIAANLAPGADTINLHDGTYKIALLGDDDLGLMGDFDVTSDIEIVGNLSDSKKVTIDGDGKSRVFDVFNGKGPSLLKLKNVMITGGSADTGACIMGTKHAAITLSNVSIFSCNATKNGGAIYLFGTSLTTIDNSSITASSSQLSGGGIWVDSSPLNITNSQLNSNQANQGGAIAIANSAVTITSTLLNTNSAAITPNSRGGAILIEGPSADVTLKSVNISENTSMTDGGGIAELDGKLTIDTSSIFKNKAGHQHDGAGIYVKGVANISNTTIADNDASANGYGGGIYIQTPGGKVSLTNVTIKRNLAAKGAGIYGPDVITSLTAKNSLIIYNAATMIPDEGDVFAAINSEGNNIVGATNVAFVTNMQPSDSFNADKSGEVGSLIIVSGTPGFAYVEVLPLSAAINNGDCSTTNNPKDQLGHDRVGACDIGAVEATCGDNVKQSTLGEECDDGNTIDGDGCSAACKVEQAAPPNAADPNANNNANNAGNNKPVIADAPNVDYSTQGGTKINNDNNPAPAAAAAMTPPVANSYGGSGCSLVR